MVLATIQTVRYQINVQVKMDHLNTSHMAVWTLKVMASQTSSMHAQQLQGAQSMTDMAVLITMRMVGLTMTELGSTVTDINRIGSKSKIAMAMELVITTVQIAVTQSLGLQEISNRVQVINSHSILANTKITTTMVLVIMRAISSLATFAPTITGHLIETVTDVKTATVTVQATHQMLAG